MKEINITEDQVNRAKELYEFTELKDSITKGKGNIYGSLGEILVYDYFNDKYIVDFNSTYDYDLIINGYKVDVKTKHTTVKPQPHYFCSVAAYNTRQACDCYLFVRVLKDFSVGWLLGQIFKKDFFTNGIFKREGELDINGWTFKADCYNLEIEKLRGFKE